MKYHLPYINHTHKWFSIMTTYQVTDLVIEIQRTDNDIYSGPFLHWELSLTRIQTFFKLRRICVSCAVLGIPMSCSRESVIDLYCVVSCHLFLVFESGIFPLGCLNTSFIRTRNYSLRRLFVNDGETPLKSWLVCWLDHSVKRRIQVEEFGTMMTRIF
jgi:hypothetical protein